MMVRIGLALSLSVIGMGLLAGIGTLEGAESAKPMHVTTIEGISEHRLENGVRVLLFPDASRPTVTVNMTVFVGSRHEGYGEAGMAHLLEHMVFKGTPTHPQVPKALQARGAEFNGTTWLDRTNYFETLPASDENLDFALGLEADRLVNSFIKAEDLASEMTVVRNEFERGENSPGYVLAHRMQAAAFEWHNYGKSTIGNRADIERVPVENLRAFYKKFYQPDNIMVIVAGRFEEAKALAMIGKHFGTLPRPERKLDATYTEEPAQDGERTVTLRRVGDVSMVGALFHIPAGAHPDFVPLDVLETSLTQQPSGRLYKALVEQKKAANIDGAAYALHDPGLLRFMSEVAPGNAPEVVLETLLDTLQIVVEKGVTAEEVERARQRLLKQREMSAANSVDLAIELSEWAAQGDWRLYFLYRDRVEQTTLDDVNRVARTYLQPTNRTVGLYLPTEKPMRTAIPATPQLAEMIGEYKGRESVATGEEFDVAPAAIEARTKRVSIGGLQAALLPKKTRGNSVVARVTLRYGNEKSLVNLGKTCDFLPSLMTRGTKKLTRQQLQDSLDQNRATLAASGSAGEATFVVQTKRDNLSNVLGLLQQVLREPALPAEELEILKRQQLAQLEQALTDPQTRAVRSIAKQLSPYPAGDVRHVLEVEEEIQAVKDASLTDLKRLHSEFLSGQSGQIVVVGDFDLEATEAKLQQIVAGWTTKQPYGRIARSGDVTLKTKLDTISIPDKANAFYFAGTVMPINDSHPDYPAMVIGNYILGAGALSSRLGDRIRQKEGLSYGVGSVMRASSLDDRATMQVYAIFNPANVTKVVDGINEEIRKLMGEGVTASELEAAAQGYLQRQQVDRTEDPTLARLLEDSLYTKRTMSYYADLEDRVKKLTPADVQAALAKHLSLDRMPGVVAGDLSKP